MPALFLAHHQNKTPCFWPFAGQRHCPALILHQIKRFQHIFSCLKAFLEEKYFGNDP